MNPHYSDCKWPIAITSACNFESAQLQRAIFAFAVWKQHWNKTVNDTVSTTVGCGAAHWEWADHPHRCAPHGLVALLEVSLSWRATIAAATALLAVLGIRGSASQPFKPSYTLHHVSELVGEALLSPSWKLSPDWLCFATSRMRNII